MTQQTQASSANKRSGTEQANRKSRAERLLDIPIEGRIRPILALRALVAMSRDPENTALGVLAAEATTGKSIERLVRRFASDPTGARILKEGRRLEDTLRDREYLEGLPKLSLGRTYLEWTEREGISAQGLIDINQDQLSRVEIQNGDLQLFRYRQTVVHDLWHVVTGYGRDQLGEIALVQVMRIQTRDTGLILATWLPFLRLLFWSSERRLIWDARRRARAAVWLPAQDWEALLPKPLDVVREILKLGSPPVYKPTSVA